MSKKNYNDIIYGFDIETTTTNHNVSLYLASFNSINFSNGKINNSFFCRTWEDVNNFLIQLNNSVESDTICLVHNLAYEFDGLVKNVDFVKNNFKNENALFLKSRIPLFFKCDKIEFRCSYKFFNDNLKNVGKYIGLEKLEIDYQSKFYSFSKLPQIEYDYNARDVEIMLKAYIKECRHWSWIKSVNDIPYTNTGLTRTNNKKINSQNDIRHMFYYCNYQKKFNRLFVDFLENLFSGGYTHANAYYMGKILKNVHSFDLTSSYPATMLLRKFP